MLAVLALLIGLSLVHPSATGAPAPSAQSPAAAAGEIIPTVRRVLEFEHAGFVYSVDMDAGRVTFVERSNVQPVPGPTPGPAPVPVPPPPAPTPTIQGAKFVSLVVDPLSPEQQAWFHSDKIRTIARDKKLEFRGFSWDEEDPVALRFGVLGLPKGVPYLVIQSEDRRQYLAKPVTSEADILEILRGL